MLSSCCFEMRAWRRAPESHVDPEHLRNPLGHSSASCFAKEYPPRSAGTTSAPATVSAWEHRMACSSFPGHTAAESEVCPTSHSAVKPISAK